MRIALVFMMLTVTTAASAQWDIQASGTKASLRGIHSLDKGVAWASGTDGTVLRTVDGGHLWQHCAVPPGAEKLDFRGVQGFDAKTAIVMSSGKGDLSRLYKTTDGCQTWKLMMTNDDPDGFWDALRMWTANDGFLAGDPVNGFLYFAESTRWNDFLDQGENPLWKVKGPGEGAFAASNSSLALGAFGTKDGEVREVWFATGGMEGSRVFHFRHFNGGEPERESLAISNVDWFPKGVSAGIFALNFREGGVGIAVGGDYLKPADGAHAAAVTRDGGSSWNAAHTLPSGYRSAVAYDSSAKTWITVGPNGTDVSNDDGRNWRALKPGANDAPDADKNWNALSLPFVVGPHGRIGVWRPAAVASKP
jgi:photosystem II stability/assembly factor-like uncharacterized protein